MVLNGMIPIMMGTEIMHLVLKAIGSQMTLSGGLIPTGMEQQMKMIHSSMTLPNGMIQMGMDLAIMSWGREVIPARKFSAIPLLTALAALTQTEMALAI